MKYLNEVNPDRFLEVYHNLQEAFYNSIVTCSPTKSM